MDLTNFELSEDVIIELENSGFNPYKETAMIKKVGNEWCVFSADGSKRLGCYPTRKEAENRLAQVEMFRHMKSGVELASFYCYCEEEGIYFYSPKRCDLVRCKGSGDDAIEIMGEF